MLLVYQSTSILIDIMVLLVGTQDGEQMKLMVRLNSRIFINGDLKYKNMESRNPTL